MVFKRIIILLIITILLFRNGKCGVQNIQDRVENDVKIRKEQNSEKIFDTLLYHYYIPNDLLLFFYVI